LVLGDKIPSRNVGRAGVCLRGRCAGINIPLGNVSIAFYKTREGIDRPPLEQYPFLVKKLHSGIFLRLYSCKNSQVSPFLHSPRSQCLHTRLLSNLELLLTAVCLSGQEDASGQWP
jgi:hypothetical protein